MLLEHQIVMNLEFYEGNSRTSYNNSGEIISCKYLIFSEK